MARTLPHLLTAAVVAASLSVPGTAHAAPTVSLVGDTLLDTSYFHRIYEQGRLRAPAQVARAVYWLVGPWGRDVHGQFLNLDDPAWQAQIAADLGSQG